MVLLDQIIDNALEGIFVCDSCNNFILWNPAMEMITGLKGPELVGKNMIVKFPYLRRSGVDRLLKQVSQGGTVTLECFPYKHPVSTQKKWIRARFVPTYKEEIHVSGFICFMKDITCSQERKKEVLLLNETLKVTTSEYTSVKERLLDANKQLQWINEQLQTAKINAKESDRLKTAFLENLSHEIRTPMNAIVGFSQLLDDKLEKTSPDKEYTRLIAQQSYVLLDVIDDVLEISSIELGQVKLKPEACSVDTLFNYLYIFFEKYKNHRGKDNIKLLLATDESFRSLEIFTDKFKLIQIFKHLLENAFKFTKQGSVEFGLYSVETDYISFFVTDTGIGIPEQQKGVIFEKFRQVTHQTDMREGLGLGLSIVQGLIKLLGGEIWVKSNVPAGTTFYFSISKNLEYQPPRKWRMPKITTLSGTEAKTILVVDDNVGLVEYFREVFLLANIKLLISSRWDDAMDVILSDTSVDLILADIELLDLVGLPLVNGVRIFRPNMPVIAETVRSTKNHKYKHLKGGYDDFITMPILPNRLLSIVFNHIQHARN